MTGGIEEILPSPSLLPGLEDRGGNVQNGGNDFKTIDRSCELLVDSIYSSERTLTIQEPIPASCRIAPTCEAPAKYITMFLVRLHL
jgi:hypothetical protein